MHHPLTERIDSLIKRKPFAITAEGNLRSAVEMMAKENLDVLPVISTADNKVTGILSYKDILSAYDNRRDEHEEVIAISLKRRSLKILSHGKKRVAILKPPAKEF